MRRKNLLGMLLCMFLSFYSSSVKAEDQAVGKAPTEVKSLAELLPRLNMRMDVDKKYQSVSASAPASASSPASKNKPKERYRPGDIWIGAFTDWHESGNQPIGFWGVGTFYPINHKDGEKTHSFGLALEGNYWYGETDNGYNYYGNRYAVDLAYRLLRPETNFEVRLGYGQAGDWGHIDTSPPGKYISDQTSDIITGYVGYEVKREKTPWFSRIRYYASADLDIGQSKTDKWIAPSGIEWPLNGEASNKTMYSLGIDGSIYDLTKTVSLAGGLSLTHNVEGSTTGLRPSIGLDFCNAKKILIGGARVNYTNWSTGDDSVGLSLYWNLAKF